MRLTKCIEPYSQDKSKHFHEKSLNGDKALAAKVIHTMNFIGYILRPDFNHLDRINFYQMH